MSDRFAQEVLDLRAQVATLTRERDTLLEQLAIAEQDKALVTDALNRANAATTRVEQERDEAHKNLAITSLAVPLEEDLSARIDETLKHLAMEDGFTLAGIARLLDDVQRRMANDWLAIGRERRLAKQQTAALERLSRKIHDEQIGPDPVFHQKKWESCQHPDCVQARALIRGDQG